MEWKGPGSHWEEKLHPSLQGVYKGIPTTENKNQQAPSSQMSGISISYSGFLLKSSHIEEATSSSGSVLDRGNDATTMWILSWIKMLQKQSITNWLGELNESKIRAGCFCTLRGTYIHHSPGFWCGSTGKFLHLQHAETPWALPYLCVVWCLCSNLPEEELGSFNYLPLSLGYFWKDLSPSKVGD